MCTAGTPASIHLEVTTEEGPGAGILLPRILLTRPVLNHTFSGEMRHIPPFLLFCL